jgi:hypothetical protein
MSTAPFVLPTFIASVGLVTGLLSIVLHFS